jgi:hypothetical protein
MLYKSQSVINSHPLNVFGHLAVSVPIDTSNRQASAMAASMVNDRLRQWISCTWDDTA